MTKEIAKIDNITNKISNLTKFDITVAELKKIVKRTEDITVDDLEDKFQIERVKRARIDLRDVEINIEKTGKSYRDVFTKINREISDKQKELLAITNPEVERLKSIVDEAKEIEIMKQRKESLPLRKQKLAKIGNKISDKELLNMTDYEFIEYLELKTEEKKEADRLKKEKEKEDARIQKELEEARKQAKLEAETEAKRLAALEKTKAEERLKEEKENAAKKLKEVEEERENEKIEAANKLKALEDEKRNKELDEKRKEDERIKEEALLEKRKEFKKWREDFGYNDDTKVDFRQEKTDNVIILFKKVGEFRL